MENVRTYIADRINENPNLGFFPLAHEAATTFKVSFNDALSAMIDVLDGVSEDA